MQLFLLLQGQVEIKKEVPKDLLYIKEFIINISDR